jgi:chorismate mutase
MGIKLELEAFPLIGGENKRPLVMAGPCSAESEEQILDTARQLSAQGIKIFRAGIWKPRTRPGAFEGVGSIGLNWLKKVKEETGMLVATEVANVKHVYESLKYGVDILWIGARTSANPFAVQEIADTLKGIDIPVLVKNPVNPDIELWIGALERLNKAGIKRLAAIHRGFSSYESSGFRNPPHWEIPIELRRRIPELPILCDPSHICGSREKLFEVSQKSMDLNFDGLIIESHCNPTAAWSDAKQQLTPADLSSTILTKLVMRQEQLTNGQNMDELRAQIDQYDDQVVEILEKRMKVAEQIGLYKKQNNVAILQTKRWDEIITKRIRTGMEKGLSAEFIESIFKAIHIESINHQTEVMNK